MNGRLKFLLTCGLSAALLFAAVALCSIFACTASAQVPRYIVTDLGQMGENDSGAYFINNYGQVTGNFHDGSDQRGFLWTPTSPNASTGSWIDLGTGAEAFAVIPPINDYGQLVTPVPLRLWTPTTPNGTSGNSVELNTLFGSDVGDDPWSWGSINNYGQLVTTVFDPFSGASDTQTFLWTPDAPNGTTGTVVDLGPPEPGFQAGINAYGQVIGIDCSADGCNTAAQTWLWTPTTPNGMSGSMVDLGALDGHTYSSPEDVNANGQVVGWSVDGVTQITHAFLWTPTTPNGTTGTMSDLGPGRALGINDRGDVVGSSDVAFLYTSASGMVDLNTLIDPAAGWHLFEANGINDLGQIVGRGVIGGQVRAFLLTPVPEPSSLALLALALPLVACRLRSTRTTLLVPQKGAVMRCLFALFCVTLAAIEPAGAAALFFRAESIPGSIDRPGLGNDWLVASGFGISVSSAVVDDPLDPPALEVTPLRIEAPASTSSPHIFAAVIQQTRLDVVQLDVVESSIDDGTAIAHWRIADTQIIRYESITENVDGEARVTDQFDVAPLGSLTYGFESYNIVGTLIGEAEFTWNLVTGEVTSEMHGNVSNFRFLTGSVDLSDLPPLAPLSPSLGGDYNQDGTVDAADYTVWRDNLGSGASLPNDDTSGVGPDDYTRWKANFGATSGPADGANAPVPEPSSLVLLALALPLIYFRGLSGQMPSSARQASRTSPAQRSADAACRLVADSPG